MSLTGVAVDGSITCETIHKGFSSSLLLLLVPCCETHRRQHSAPSFRLPAVSRGVGAARRHYDLERRTGETRRHHLSPGPQGPLVLWIVRQARTRLRCRRVDRIAASHPRTRS